MANKVLSLSPVSLAVMAAIGLVSGLAGAAIWDLAGLGQKAQGEATRDYLLAHPEVLPEVFDVLRQREQSARIDPLRQQLEAAYPGAVLGNPNGSLTLVEFSDYACGYCRGSVADVEALIAGNPDLKVVIREYPILSEHSAAAARMALAAADQGKFAAFHKAMFAEGRPSDETIAAAAQKAGVDLAKAKAAIDAGTYEFELTSNVQIARELGFDGTPSWVIGNQGYSGAVGLAALTQAVEKAKASDAEG